MPMVLAVLKFMTERIVLISSIFIRFTCVVTEIPITSETFSQKSALMVSIITVVSLLVVSVKISVLIHVVQ